MTRAELSRFDGREGRKAYVAVQGRIYDVSASAYWQGGNHLDRHQAGNDLTADLQAAPHVRAVIERYPVVGELAAEMKPLKPGGGKGIALVAGIVILALGAWLLLR